MTRGAVLVVGVYLADRPTLVADIVSELRACRQWSVEQRWAAIGHSPVAAAASAVTVERVLEPEPKFTLINRLLSGVSPAHYRYVIVCDDDIELPGGFLDGFLALVEQYDLALSQPARTTDSFIDHPFVGRLGGLSARRTRFVEIGPLFCVRGDALGVLTPFDEASPMGWGYDLAWPCVMADAGLRMGIVDAVPVRHAFRKPVAYYSHATADAQMRAYLSGRAHLTLDRACVVLESHA